MALPESTEREQLDAPEADEQAPDLTPHPPPSDEMERIATQHQLMQMGTVQPLVPYLKELWQRRHFAVTLSWSRFSARNTNDRLGMLWNILRPLLQALIYAAVFGLLFPRARGSSPLDYIKFVTSGVFAFTFLSGCLTSGAKAVTGDLGLVRTLRFPRAVLPLSTTLIELYSYVPSLGVLFVILLALGERPDFDLLLLPVAVLLSAAFGLGMAFICARITVIIRDFAQLLPFILRIVFYISGVVINIETNAELKSYASIYYLLRVEPFHIYINLLRQCVIRGKVDRHGHAITTDPIGFLSASEWRYGVAWAVVAVVVGFVFFRRGEETYGR